MFVNSNDFLNAHPVNPHYSVDDFSGFSADRRREFVTPTPPRTSPRFEPIDQLIDRLVVPSFN